MRTLVNHRQSAQVVFGDVHDDGRGGGEEWKEIYLYGGEKIASHTHTDNCDQDDGPVSGPSF